MRKKTMLTMILALVIFSFASIANASLFSSAYIAAYSGEVIDYGNGKLGVNYSITGRDVMDQIGAKTVLLQERDNPLDEWRTVATFTSSSYPGMLVSNAGRHNYTLYYYNADTDSHDYRAKIYFYSEKGGYDTREYITYII